MMINTLVIACSPATPALIRSFYALPVHRTRGWMCWQQYRDAETRESGCRSSVVDGPGPPGGGGHGAGGRFPIARSRSCSATRATRRGRAGADDAGVQGGAAAGDWRVSTTG